MLLPPSAQRQKLGAKQICQSWAPGLCLQLQLENNAFWLKEDFMVRLMQFIFGKKFCPKIFKATF